MKRGWTGGLLLGLGPLCVAACGSSLDLGDRRGADAAAAVDAGAEIDPRASDAGEAGTVDAGETGTVDASTVGTCGRGTTRSSCQVFVTDARTEADFGGLAGADARCAAAASGAGLTGSFKAYLSDGTIAAWSRFRADGPWLNVGTQQVIFPTAAGLKTDGPQPLDRNERGEVLRIPGHWTGVREQGFGGPACAGFTSRSKSLSGSFGSTAPSRWQFQADVTCDSPVGHHLLCLED